LTEVTDPWADRSFLRDVQYRTDANLAARQSIYSYQHPHIDLQSRVLDLAAPAAGETVSRAVRELRRVTRPGGRVVIGLNGLGHLRQLRAIVATARGDDIWGQHERLTLDDGAALAGRYFSTVTRHDFVSELRIPGPEPVADYVRSMSGTQHSADPEPLVASVVARFPADPGAVLTVTTHAGCLICTV
jgi:SAM-dependent methyltransferase